MKGWGKEIEKKIFDISDGTSGVGHCRFSGVFE